MYALLKMVNYAIVEINYIGNNNTKPNIDIDKNRLDIVRYDDDDCLCCDIFEKFKLNISMNIFILHCGKRKFSLWINFAFYHGFTWMKFVFTYCIWYKMIHFLKIFIPVITCWYFEIRGNIYKEFIKYSLPSLFHLK